MEAPRPTPRVDVLAPDGKSIEYAVTRSDATNIWRMPIDGGRPVQTTYFDRDTILQFA
jgi:hypothetical protein